MSTRMEKYDSNIINNRTKRNEKLYDNVMELDPEYIDINNAIEIDSKKDSNKLTRSEYQRKKEIDKLIPSSKKEIINEEEEPKENNRVYDINEILKLARENRLFESDDKKRLINTEYNILTKLDISKIEETKDDSKENLRKLIDTIYGTSEKNNPETLEKKDDTKVLKDGLLDDLLNDNDIVLTEETSKLILDKEDNNDKDNSNDEIKLIEEDTLKEKETSKEKEEDEDKDKNKDKDKEESSEKEENDVDTEFIDLELKRGKKILIIIIIVVIILLLAGGYLFYKYFI